MTSRARGHRAFRRHPRRNGSWLAKLNVRRRISRLLDGVPCGRRRQATPPHSDQSRGKLQDRAVEQRPVLPDENDVHLPGVKGTITTTPPQLTRATPSQVLIAPFSSS
ncbi:MAG: hypothetical protein MZU95_09950 [Desulfomicrobium escambiense]|nr:hypothetical protein [Desulfomicrobium escambiense]